MNNLNQRKSAHTTSAHNTVNGLQILILILKLPGEIELKDWAGSFEVNKDLG